METLVRTFSHVSLAAPSENLHLKCIKFYNALGFRTIKQTNHSTESNNPDVWVQLFSRQIHAANFSQGLTLRITLKSDFEKTEFNQKDFENEINLKNEKLLLIPEVSQDGADPDINAFASFSDADISAISSVLRSLDNPFIIVKHYTSKKEERAKTLLTYDPLGNLIAFNDYPAPFSGQAPSKPPINSIAAQTLGQEFTRSLPLRRGTINLEEHLPMASAWSIVNNPSDLTAAGKNIGILTSGGDSSGMNAAVRAICRVSLQRQCTPFAIYEGYQGLVDGGNMIRKMGWEDVRGILSMGGTNIGTARCLPFRTREGRLSAAENMIKNGIDALVVCGGDGSLTGGDLLRSEWTGLVEELIATERVTEEEAAGLRNHLTIVGLVGSIDNDMAATDITIGAYSSLHRICESLDSLTSTAMSHQRAFVVEVMGRHCGWQEFI
ncbi:6-phosphofructokinase, alpha subunit [Nowakowskiella sp. JEL0078]|nr:6-phosphofructokinase, alpha subunit [Nowakowskiella sp. JEL0078]